MWPAAVLAVFLGLTVSPAIAAEPVNWDNIVFEWVTVTATECPCSSTSSTASSAIPSTSILSSAVSESTSYLLSGTSVALAAPRYNTAVVQNVVTSVPKPSITSYATTVSTWIPPPPAPTPTSRSVLKPAVLKQGLTNPENLRPSVQHELYYADNSNAGVDGASMPVANIVFNFTMETVNLESTSHIQSVTCSFNPADPNTSLMRIDFNDKTAYEVAINTWPKDSDFLVLGYFPGCGDYVNDKRTISKVHELSVDSDSMEIVVVVEDMPFHDMVSSGDMKFGSFSAAYMAGTAPEKNSSGTYSGVGVPAECLGDKVNDFDVKLDNELGIDKDHPSFSARLRSKRELRRRRQAARFSRFSSSTDVERFVEKRWSIGGFFEDIGSAISSAVSSVVDTVKDAAEAAWDGVTGAMKDIGQAIIDAGKTIIGTVADFDYIDTTAKWDTFLSKDTKWPEVLQRGAPQNTPWNLPGFLLWWGEAATTGGDTAEKQSPGKAPYEFDPYPTPTPTPRVKTVGETKLYCVNCGVSGDLKFNGHIIFSLKDGLTKASFTMNGTMHSNVQLGLSGDAAWQAKVATQLFQIPLSPLEIPGLILVGPSITVSAEAAAIVSASGLITAGFAMDWTPFIDFDLVNKDTKDQGWNPVIHPLFEAEGELVASVGLSLPITLGFGLTFFQKWEYKAGITEKPGIRLSARAAMKAESSEELSYLGFDAGYDRPGNFSCPNSVALFFDFTNNIDLEVTNVFKKPLGRAVVPLLQKCIGGGFPTSTVPLIEPTPSPTTETPEEDPEPTDTTSSTVDEPTPVAVKRQIQSLQIPGNWSVTSSLVATSVSPSTTLLEIPRDTSSVVWTSSVVTGSEFPTLSVYSSISSPQYSQTPTASATPTAAISSMSSGYPQSSFFQNSTATTSTVPQSSVQPSTSPTPKAKLATVTLRDAVDGLFINTNADGTVFLCNGACGSPAEFYVQSNVIVADTSERFLHFYSNEMDKYGVSRLRLHGAGNLPNKSSVVGLADIGQAKVVAMVPGGKKEFLFPVACRIEGAPTKMFLVKDSKKGIEQLKQLGKELVGGEVLGCSLKNLRIVDGKSA